MMQPAASVPALPRPMAPVCATAVGRYGRMSLARQFLLASLAIVVVGMLVTGAWVGQEIESGVLSRTAAITALYVDSIITPHLQPLARQTNLDPADVAALDQLISNTPLAQGVVAFKVWSPDGVVLYSPNRRLLGRRFPIEGGLARAVGGDVSAEMSRLDEPENEYEREHWSRLLEVYAPVRQNSGGRIMAVTEFYQLPNDLDAEIGAARLRSWAVIAGIALVTYLLLAGIVRRGSDTIGRQRAALEGQVAELQRLLDQNGRLHERVRQAAGRTTALNERALRRISADLHDGPGQDLALALLRLEALQAPCDLASCVRPSSDFAVVRGAVRDALAEVRAIAVGLRLPELGALPVAEVAERAVRDHERRSATAVHLELGQLLGDAPLALKIALHRTVQEALSNATRHGHGLAVVARVWADADALYLLVSDAGPGFVPDQLEGSDQLGLTGMRERAELLGGSFRVESAPGRGTTVRVSWPLPERAAR